MASTELTFHFTYFPCDPMSLIRVPAMSVGEGLLIGTVADAFIVYLKRPLNKFTYALMKLLFLP